MHSLTGVYRGHSLVYDFRITQDRRDSGIPEEEFSLPQRVCSARTAVFAGKSSTLWCWKVRSSAFGQQD